MIFYLSKAFKEILVSTKQYFSSNLITSAPAKIRKANESIIRMKTILSRRRMKLIIFVIVDFEYALILSTLSYEILHSR